MTATDGSRPGITRSQWGVILLLAAVNFTHITDFVIIMPLSEQLMRELAITTNQFGHIVSAYGIAAFAAVMLSALVIDRFDRRTVLLASYFGFAASTLYCGLADTYELLLLSRGLAGACGGIAASAIMAIIGDVFHDSRRGTAIGMVTSAFAVASVVGLPLGLALAESFGRGAPFVAIAALSVPVWLFAFLKLPSLTAHTGAGFGNPVVELLAAARHPEHWPSFAFMFTLVMGTFTVIPFLAPYLELNCGQSKRNIAVIYAAAGAITLVSMNAIGLLTDRVGKRPVFLALATASIAMTFVVTNLPEVSLAGAILAAAGFMVAASGRVVPAQAMMLASAVPAMRGRFSSLNTAMQHLATGVAPLISGAVVTRSDPRSPLVGYSTAGSIAVGFAAVALALSFLLRTSPRPVEAKVDVGLPLTPNPSPAEGEGSSIHA
jgi:predicted MFS family arabinose efflux permease